MNSNRILKHNTGKKDLSVQRTGNHLNFRVVFLFGHFLITVFLVNSEKKITLISLVTDKINFLFSLMIQLLHFFSFPFRSPVTCPSGSHSDLLFTE